MVSEQGCVLAFGERLPMIIHLIFTKLTGPFHLTDVINGNGLHSFCC
jgi:hypothetical protein